MRERAIDVSESSDVLRGEGAFTILFASAARPDAEAVAAACAGVGAAVSARPGDAREGWCELVAHGLTFDLRGLVPGASQPLPAIGQLIGLDAERTTQPLAAFKLLPGEHIQSAAHQLPVVRVMSAIASALGTLPGAVAIVWHGAGTWIEPRYFSGVVAQWANGGPFPAPGLVGLRRDAGGQIETQGLSFFTGQEMRIESGEGENLTPLAIRAIDMLADHGTLTGRHELAGLAGDRWWAETSPEGRLVVIRRAG